MQLRVKPRKRKDAGTGLAAIDRETMDDLGVSSGEFVAIDGPDGRVVARVWPGPAEDTGRGIVRIDGQLRQAAGARIDDPVSVEPATRSSSVDVRPTFPSHDPSNTPVRASGCGSPSGPAVLETKGP